MRLSIVIVLIVLIGYGTGDCAEKSKAKTTKKQSQNEESIYSTAPINFGVTKLPKNYYGHDISTLFNALSKLDRVGDLIKDEYETTEQYNIRKEKLINAPLVGSLGINDYFVIGYTPEFTAKSVVLDNGINIDTSNTGRIKQKYDADKKSMMLSVPSSICSTTKGTQLNCTNQQLLVMKEPDYIASNKMGASVFVSKSMTVWNRLALTNYPKEVSFVFDNIDVKEAKIIKDKYAILFICKLESPYKDNKTHITTPDMDNPVDSSTHIDLVIAGLSEFWLYDFETGKIIQKQKYSDYINK